MTQTLTITEFEKNLKKVEKGTAQGKSYLIYKAGLPLFRVEPPLKPDREKKYTFRDIIQMVERLPKKRGPKTRYSLDVDEILYGNKA